MNHMQEWKPKQGLLQEQQVLLPRALSPSHRPFLLVYQFTTLQLKFGFKTLLAERGRCWTSAHLSGLDNACKLRGCLREHWQTSSEKHLRGPTVPGRRLRDQPARTWSQGRDFKQESGFSVGIIICILQHICQVREMGICFSCTASKEHSLTPAKCRQLASLQLSLLTHEKRKARGRQSQQGRSVWKGGVSV